MPAGRAGRAAAVRGGSRVAGSPPRARCTPCRTAAGSPGWCASWRSPSAALGVAWPSRRRLSCMRASASRPEAAVSAAMTQIAGRIPHRSAITPDDPAHRDRRRRLPAWRARSVGVYRLWRDGGRAHQPKESAMANPASSTACRSRPATMGGLRPQVSEAAPVTSWPQSPHGGVERAPGRVQPARDAVDSSVRPSCHRRTHPRLSQHTSAAETSGHSRDAGSRGPSPLATVGR